MDCLPQEIIDRIASFIERKPKLPSLSWKEQRKLKSTLPPLATLSAAWRRAIELRSFERLEISSTDLGDFQRIVSGRRRDNIRFLILSTVLPTYSDEDCGRIESGETMVANNEAFTCAIATLFDILKSWEDDQVSGTLALRLGPIYAPMDRNHRDRQKLERNMTDQFIGKRVDLFEQRYAFSQIDLEHPANLPTLKRITTFESSRSWQRRLALWSIADIMAKLPSVENIYWDLDDMDIRSGSRTVDQSIRRKSRLAIALALNRLDLRSVKDADIKIYHDSPSDHNTKTPNLIPNEWIFDPLSDALRRLSTNLTTFALEGTFDSTLFWPYEEKSSRDPELPIWPNLTQLRVRFNSTASDGDWYFTGEPQLPHANENYCCYFRCRPDEVRLSPFLLAFAKALQRMPMLKIATLTCEELNDADSIKGCFSMGYYAPGMAADWGDEGGEYVGSRRIYYEVGRWRPEEQIQTLMRQTGREMHGGEAIERFLSSQWDPERDEW